MELVATQILSDGTTTEIYKVPAKELEANVVKAQGVNRALTKLGFAESARVDDTQKEEDCYYVHKVTGKIAIPPKRVNVRPR